jgi:hypothetical protein
MTLAVLARDEPVEDAGSYSMLDLGWLLRLGVFVIQPWGGGF